MKNILIENISGNKITLDVKNLLNDSEYNAWVKTNKMPNDIAERAKDYYNQHNPAKPIQYYKHVCNTLNCSVVLSISGESLRNIRDRQQLKNR